MARILVSYASRYGSTAGIAGAIAESLTDTGFDVDVLRPSPQLDVSKYDGVVIGSPAYGRKWLPDAAIFAVANDEKLAHLPVALFTVGMLGVKNPKSALREHGWIMEELVKLAPGLQPVSTALFHGAFDRSHLPLCLRIMDRLAGTPQGDHRDWEAIRNWGKTVSERFNEALAENGAQSADDDSEESSE